MLIRVKTIVLPEMPPTTLKKDNIDQLLLTYPLQSEISETQFISDYLVKRQQLALADETIATDFKTVVNGSVKGKYAVLVWKEQADGQKKILDIVYVQITQPSRAQYEAVASTTEQITFVEAEQPVATEPVISAPVAHANIELVTQVAPPLKAVIVPTTSKKFYQNKKKQLLVVTVAMTCLAICCLLFTRDKRS